MVCYMHNQKDFKTSCNCFYFNYTNQKQTLGIKHAPRDNEDDAKETVAEGVKAAEHEGKDAVGEQRRKMQRRKRDILCSPPLSTPQGPDGCSWFLSAQQEHHP
ncbi:hypothetical protein ACFX19_022650 [Malus domestica]